MREDPRAAEVEDGLRVDLHLHSRASGTAGNWWVRGLGAAVEARESYTEPEAAYRMAKATGMDLVTLTDHETIDGALGLLDYEDFFVGEEVSALFPEDGSQVDVLIYGIDPEVHVAAQARRPNVYELVDYLREEGVVHILAHPMYGMPGNLDRAQVEKRLVLFGTWEFINGSRPAAQNRLAREIAESVGAAELRQLAARHGLLAPPHRSICGTGGSDDHGGLYGGATWTLAPGLDGGSGPAEFLAALAGGEVRPAGADGSVAGIIRTGVRIADCALKEDAGSGRRAVRSLEQLVLQPSLKRYFRWTERSGGRVLDHVPFLARMEEPEIRAELVARYERKLRGAMGGMGSGFPVMDFLGSLGDFMDGHLYLAPYLGVNGYFGREERKARELRRELFPDASPGVKAGIFLDGMDGVHGVSTMYTNLQRRLSLADSGSSGSSSSGSGEVRIVTCGPAAAGAGRPEEGSPREFRLRSVAEMQVPLYDDLVLGVPSLLEVMEHIVEEGYDVLHVAAPGPLGLATLVCGLALGVPVVGAYHTEFGDYARALSGDAFVAELVEVAVREFYERCTVVAVPSRATELSLRNRGYRVQSFRLLKNGVDTDLFTPARRDLDLHHRLGDGRRLLLYAGRVSREKGLERFAATYRELRERRDDVHLVVAGDGPYRPALERELGDAATFTGFLAGEELARLYASCDLFAFPSTTDTLGRAVVEAQASGLPAVVYATGGPRECLRPGVSGLAVPVGNGTGDGTGDGARFLAALEELLDSDDLRLRMGAAAREFATTLGWDAALDDLFDLHSTVTEAPQFEPAR